MLLSPSSADSYTVTHFLIRKSGNARRSESSYWRGGFVVPAFFFFFFSNCIQSTKYSVEFVTTNLTCHVSDSKYQTRTTNYSSGAVRCPLE